MRHEIVIPYLPRAQFVEFHERFQRWAVLVVHRRGGKTVAVINDLIKRAMLCDKPSPRFAYIAPTYSQAKDVAWAYLKRFTSTIPGVAISEGELHVTLPGDRRIRLYGADNYDRLRGIYLDGCAIDECADLDAKAWVDVIRPALSDRQGWCVWIGTPKGRDNFYRLWKDAASDPEFYTMRLPASESGLLPPEELEAARKAMASQRGAYEREFECSFEAPVNGSIYGDIITDLRTRKLIREMEWDRDYPVFASWDLGWNDATSVWMWQLIGRDMLWAWHTSQRGKTAAQMAQLIRDAQIPIAAHFLPHDAANTSASTGTSYRAELTKAGLLNLNTVPQPRNIWSGINALRGLLQRSSFRLPHCAQGLEALEAYHTKDTTSNGIISKEPVHDWASHDADAARIAAEAIELGMVRTSAAIKYVSAPRYPDGSMVDLETSAQRRRRPARVLSGHSPL